MEKKLKVMAARAESAPTRTSSGFVADHWFVRKQKPTNHRKVQRAREITRGRVGPRDSMDLRGPGGTQRRTLPRLWAV